MSNPEPKVLHPLEEIKEPSAGPWKRFEHANFEFLYDSFRQPLTEIVSPLCGIVGLSNKGEFRRFQHTALTRGIEEELAEHAGRRDAETLDMRLTHHFGANNGSLDDTLKYLLCFYKVFRGSKHT